MPSTFDFTLNVVADTDPNSGPAQHSAAQTVDGELVAERQTWMGDGAPRCKYAISRAGSSPRR